MTDLRKSGTIAITRTAENVNDMGDVILFPMECPACKTASGHAHSVDGKVREGALTLRVRCVYCEHEWRHAILVATGTGAHDSGAHRKFPKPHA